MYRGLIPPLLGVGFEKAIVFGIYENTSRILKYYDVKEKKNIAISGACAGFAASFIVTPFERLKIQLQSNASFNLRTMQLGQLFNGLSACFTREIPGFAIYFSVYESLKSKHLENNQYQISYQASFFYGGLSGATAWLFIYP